MKRQLNILIVVKQRPLFIALRHILNDSNIVDKSLHIRTWSALKTRLKQSQLLDEFDIILIDTIEVEQREAVSQLRRQWPDAKVGLLAFDREIVSYRAGDFDVVISKSNAVQELSNWLSKLINPQPHRILAKSLGSYQAKTKLLHY